MDKTSKITNKRINNFKNEESEFLSSNESDDEISKIEMDKDKDDMPVTTELRYFPNKKTTINFNEFCQIFNESITSKDI